MAETPEQRVARLEAELAQAKVEALQKQLDAARAGAAGAPVASTWTPSAQPEFGSVRFGKSPPPDTHLAPAPRAVPMSYRLIVTPFNWVILFLLFMIAVAPIAVWIFVPLAGVIVGGVAFVLVMWLFVRRWVIRNALLKWGEVATVVNPDVVSVGTYYSGTTVQNVRIAQAHGWTVERQWYSGPVTKTRVEYVLNGVQGSVTIRGLPYDNGVILADTRRPTRGLCIHSFPFDIERDPSGNWTGKVSPRVTVTSILMLDLVLAWTAAMVVICGNAANLW